MNNQRNDGPSVEQLRAELERVRYRRRYMSTLRSTIYMLVALATVVLLAVLWLPVFRVSGDSMAGTLDSGDIVVTRRTTSVDRGDLVVFGCDNGKTLIKRVIGMAGDEIDLLDDGTVLLNGAPLDEEYVLSPESGACDVELPLVIPDGCLFVMGDNRAESVDSRSAAIGCISEDQVVGCVIARVWPLKGMELFLPAGQLWRNRA